MVLDIRKRESSTHQLQQLGMHQTVLLLRLGCDRTIDEDQQSIRGQGLCGIEYQLQQLGMHQTMLLLRLGCGTTLGKDQPSIWGQGLHGIEYQNERELSSLACIRQCCCCGY
jgi:hypothetical protein